MSDNCFSLLDKLLRELFQSLLMLCFLKGPLVQINLILPNKVTGGNFYLGAFLNIKISEISETELKMGLNCLPYDNKGSGGLRLN